MTKIGFLNDGASSELHQNLLNHVALIHEIMETTTSKGSMIFMRSLSPKDFTLANSRTLGFYELQTTLTSSN